MPTHTVWSGCQWVGCLEVENKKSPKTGTRHQSGRPCAPSRMHIFPHFSEFLLIFHRRSILTKIAPLCVCVCEVFELHPRGERLECGCVGCGSIQPVKVAFDSPARAESFPHFFIFLRFLSIFAQSQKLQPRECGVDTEWVGCLEVGNENDTHCGISTPSGPSPCAESNAHFFTFF